MLTCLPQSFCSWNYRVLGTSAGTAELTLNMGSEEGSILLGEAEFTVRQFGCLPSRWALEQDGRPIIEACKPSIFFRDFELSMDGTAFTLRIDSPFTLSFTLFSSGPSVGTIRRAHPFTWRAIINCSQMPELVQLFSFWLVVAMWRRTSWGKA